MLTIPVPGTIGLFSFGCVQFAVPIRLGVVVDVGVGANGGRAS